MYKESTAGLPAHRTTLAVKDDLTFQALFLSIVVIVLIFRTYWLNCQYRLTMSSGCFNSNTAWLQLQFNSTAAVYAVSNSSIIA